MSEKPKIMDAVQTKVQDAITGMINTLDKKCLRRMQVCSCLLMIRSHIGSDLPPGFDPGQKNGDPSGKLINKIAPRGSL